MPKSFKHRAHYVWSVLGEILDIRPKLPMPKIHRYLSEASKGSLKGRSIEEIALVHRQQKYDEAITLLDPPEAWVKNSEQVAEEAAHMFALIHAPHCLPKKVLSAYDIYHLDVLHEAFAAFACAITLQPARAKRPTGAAKMKDPNRGATPAKVDRMKPAQRWQAAHREGYALGQAWAESFLSETFDRKAFRRWFRGHWV